jgi:hypothetical protein
MAHDWHVGQLVPPQHTDSTQPPAVQSPATLHACPAMHFGQVGPPQSTSVSVPSFIPSLQPPPPVLVVEVLVVELVELLAVELVLLLVLELVELVFVLVVELVVALVVVELVLDPPPIPAQFSTSAQSDELW